MWKITNMSVWQIVLGISDIVACVSLLIIVLVQQGRSAGLSNSISGSSSDTFFGKNKGRSTESRLSKATTVLAIIFVVLTLVLNGMAIAAAA